MGLFKGHNTTIRENKISDFTVSTAQYGASVSEILGTTRISPNVIYWDDFTAHEHRETQRSGKGGGSKTTTISYTYTVAAILALCEGPIAGIGKMWKGKNIYQYPNEEVGLTLFSGTSGQKPWAYVQGKHPEKALAYENLAYMAGVIDLGDSGSMPSYNFEVKGKLLDTGDGVDVNPADYILYVLKKVGLGDVEIDGIDNYRKYCKEADLLISTPSDSTDAKTARGIVNEIANITNAYFFWSNDRFKIVPRADRAVGNWKPDKTIRYNLTPDDLIPQSGGACITYSRKDSSEIYNRISVEFLNRSNGYEKEIVNYQDNDDIKEFGVRQASTTTAHYLYTKDRAVKLAEELCRKNKYERVKYTFKLDWAFCRLEPGDLVTLTDPAMGIESQPAMIDSVTEGTDGVLTFTAISRAKGNYTAAQYDVHENERPFVEYNKEASDTVPIIFQPPADLTSNGLGLWIAAKGKTDGWGGCNVYVSDNNTNYRLAGQTANSARCGKLISDIAKDSTDIIVSCNDQLISGTQQDAERKNTLCWIGGECFSYVTATLQTDGNYKLSGCIRGQYNTKPSVHSAGADFVRLDASVLHLDFTKEDIGKKIYLKFPSVNIFGEGEQDLSAVQAYEYTLQNYYIPPVTAVSAHSRYRQQVDKKSLYDVVVSWAKPDLQSYLQGDVWYKTKAATDTGYGTEWQFAGSGETEVTIPQCVAGTFLHITVCTKDKFGAVTAPDTSPATEILVALKNATPTTPEGFSVSFGSVCTASWKEVTNTDVAFYEIRTDQSPGVETSGLLARTNNLSAILSLTERSGTLYLYAKSAIGKYSTPAILQYNKPVPKKPNPPKLTATIGGFGLTAEAIPADCAGMNIYINSTDGQKTIKTENNSYSHTCGSGIYDVSIAYYDLFGEGEKSEESRVTVKISISKEMLEDEAVSLEKVDKAIQNAVTSANTQIPILKSDVSQIKQTETSITQTVQRHTGDISQIKQTASGLASTVQNNKAAQDSTNASVSSQITQNANKITSVVTNLGDIAKAKASYSAITQLQDAINLKVQKGDVINQINLSPTTTTIDGKYLHVTGTTKFDNGVITNGMLAAKSVTADKLSVSSLSAMCATIGTLRTKTSGARLEIKDNLLEVYDENNMLRVRLGVWN